MPDIQVASGKFFNLLGCKPEDVKIQDIAAHLPNLCRFTGAVREFYSVAQHSVIVSWIVPPHLALCGLLHDATEAYINDLSRPMKQIAKDYVAYERNVLWPVIAKQFGLPEEIPPEVHEADNIVLVTERRDLMPPAAPEDLWRWEWAKDIIPLKGQIHPWTPARARMMFKERWFELTEERI